MTLAESLKKVRKEHNLTQQDIANILGIDRTTYTFYETGKTPPSYFTLRRLANAYNCSLDYLTGEESSAGRGAFESIVASRGFEAVSMKKEEQLVLMCYRLVPEEKKAEVLEYLKKLCEQKQ